jgi:predicted nucleotide-binding protein (sugar kinase/HSP70/actin superfamily)
MKISNFRKNEIAVRLEEFARKLNQTAQQMGMQDPQAFAEQIRKKAAELLSLLKTTLFQGRIRVSRPEFFRTRIKKRVMENLEETFQDSDLIDQITDSLVQVAKEDPYYRRLFSLEETCH